MTRPLRWAALGLALTAAVVALAQTQTQARKPAPAADDLAKVDIALRRAIAERLPQFPPVDEVRPTPIPGLYELRFGTDIRYTDAKGEYLIEGDLVDLKTRRSLTQARVDKLTAVDFSALPLADAMVTKRGNGSRRLAVFEDPNCGYCKQFERGLADIKDVTIYTFLIPILGPASQERAKAIWCSKDAYATWQDWMLRSVPPPKLEGPCDDGALTRNLAFARKHQINGTPALVFQDGTRIPGAIGPDQIEDRLKRAAEKKS
jgi:thiol:disulfide interchange protein DsbC